MENLETYLAISYFFFLIGGLVLVAIGMAFSGIIFLVGILFWGIALIIVNYGAKKYPHKQ